MPRGERPCSTLASSRSDCAPPLSWFRLGSSPREVSACYGASRSSHEHCPPRHVPYSDSLRRQCYHAVLSRARAGTLTSRHTHKYSYRYLQQLSQSTPSPPTATWVVASTWRRVGTSPRAHSTRIFRPVLRTRISPPSLQRPLCPHGTRLSDSAWLSRSVPPCGPPVSRITCTSHTLDNSQQSFASHRLEGMSQLS